MMADAYAIPQDDYFEWEDLMNNRPFTSYDHDFSFIPDYQTPKDLYSCFESIEQQATPQAVSLPLYENFNIDWSDSCQSKNDIETFSIVSKNIQSAPEKQDNETNQLQTKEDYSRSQNNLLSKTHDDLDIAVQPTQNVDYLAFPWHRCESDLWASRKHLEFRRKKIDGHQDQTYDRLINASWRAVAVGRLKLKKVDPRSFNWLKDQDLTWLHGPFVPHSTRQTSVISNQISQFPKITVKSLKQESRPSKSALKQPSLKTLLLRGSNPPARNPKKRNIDALGQKKRQKQALRFSSEVLQFSCLPTNIGSEGVTTSPSTIPLVPKININNLVTSSNAQSLKYHHNNYDSPRIGHNMKSELTAKSSTRKECTESSTESHYQLPTGIFRSEQLSEDVAAFRRALREAVDAQQRNIHTYQYYPEILLRPTITA